MVPCLVLVSSELLGVLEQLGPVLDLALGAAAERLLLASLAALLLALLVT